MPLLVGLLILFAAVYQFFFRYEYWPSKDKEGVFYEHDNLTGATYKLQPGAKVNVVARIMGQDGIEKAGSSNGDSYFESMNRGDWPAGTEPEGAKPVSSQKPVSRGILEDGKAIPVPKEIIVATTAPPVPTAMLATDIDDARQNTRPFAVRQIDLNRDGTAEEIIQNALQSDGLLDISIVKDGKEIFYGRGKQISLLSTRSVGGWADIALKIDGGKSQAYRYSPSEGNYKPLAEQALPQPRRIEPTSGKP